MLFDECTQEFPTNLHSADLRWPQNDNALNRFSQGEVVLRLMNTNSLKERRNKGKFISGSIMQFASKAVTANVDRSIDQNKSQAKRLNV